MSRSHRKLGRVLGAVVLGAVVIGIFGKVVGAQEPSSTAASPTTSTTTSPTTRSGGTAPTASAPVMSAVEPETGFVVIAVVDGDTVRVRPPGSDGQLRVRLIGIDAPETGTCEAAAAATALETLVLNRTVTLTMGGDGEDLDPYGRALRYVDTVDGDAGLALINGGHAIARFDSRDGYGRHDREDDYVAADAPSAAWACPAAAPTTTEAPDSVPLVPDAGDDDESRMDHGSVADDPPAAAAFPNCAAARAAGAAPLYVGTPGYSSELDRDGDGVACE